ncbi:MAG: CusA/CzcA family heavy metal efflux RND transporter [Cyclobacteriaceae bacterium]
MIKKMIQFSLSNKLIVLLLTGAMAIGGAYSLSQLSIGAVPDITNNQVQVITTTRDLSTEDVEKFITYPVELEMANLPGVQEIRSISKFGLSVVTIVFEDRMGSYLPRQLIAEKIKSASEQIPSAFGAPAMGPITTGLGEIYQYVLEVDSAFQGRYTTMDLRSIQDWIVKRQLSGIPGVVEVNTWGGKLKQYEVALLPDRLLSLRVSPLEVYRAVAANNSLVGGGYIEKMNQSYFLRGEGLLKSIADIENLVVDNRDGALIRVKDVATVGLGSATRFGAITGNGEGEKVLGQVMMLKDANSLEVIESVKKRVEEVQKSLPPGIRINGFLERSALIDRTTDTIIENLLLGCLIVIFVVVVLLGNFRSGLIVSSVIPLSLMFAFTMMYLFDIDANLMSLGAIDFGIIIDGAVIIVEFTAFNLANKDLSGLTKIERASIVDQIALDSSDKMTRTAVFGQIIIIMVFIPILSLKGVEGKLFIPMALTFCFALVGAMLLGFTYVPVINSLLLKSKSNADFSAGLIKRLEKVYQPTLSRVLARPRLTLVIALTLVISATITFVRMGGEFVPTLDEGDFVIQPVLKTGTSLSKTIETVTKIEKVIKRFPEVEQVVTRIGAAEVPTDPMSMEETDVIITLKDKAEWTSAQSKDELADQIKKTLIDEMPVIDFEFTQPIEMRFNELITGVRSDIAIKLFGEDLNYLYQQATLIEELIEEVPGAADISIEKIVGLPQVKIQVDHEQAGRYGLTAEDVNELISMAYAGKVVGQVYEGERKFDLKVILDHQHRESPDEIQNLMIPIGDNRMVPLSALATISASFGPAKISRDDTKRRVVVGINVRNRDLESVVNDIQQIIDKEVILRPGYEIEYGGQFKNLQQASKRLQLAVPAALMLILLLLYFAFHSMKDALIIFTAIPMAAVGGVFLLWLRGMPFSISAGIGFIALFGIAVLNGIVLIDRFKELEERNEWDGLNRVLQGATQRLRPVLLTASAAALGFLPMALSTSSGAEVQRPLATVVIGGLFTSTILTLLVLPVLYYTVSNLRLRKFKLGKLAAAIGLVMSAIAGQAQEVTLIEAQQQALQNHPQARIGKLKIEKAEKQIKSSWSLDRTNLYYGYDENNLNENNMPLHVLGIDQAIRFPTAMLADKQVKQEEVNKKKIEYGIQAQNIYRDVGLSFYQLKYQQDLLNLLNIYDSAFIRLADIIDIRQQLGETNMIDKLRGQKMVTDNRLAIDLANEQFELALRNLRLLINDSTIERVTSDTELISISKGSELGDQFWSQNERIGQAQLKQASHEALPDLHLEYFQGNDRTNNGENYIGFEVGVGIPIFFSKNRSAIQMARIEQSILSTSRQQYQLNYQQKRNELLKVLAEHKAEISYYRASGEQYAKELLELSMLAFENGEIDFYQLSLSIQESQHIQIQFLKKLKSYNQTALKINHLVF